MTGKILEGIIGESPIVVDSTNHRDIKLALGADVTIREPFRTYFAIMEKAIIYRLIPNFDDKRNYDFTKPTSTLQIIEDRKEVERLTKKADEKLKAYFTQIQRRGGWLNPRFPASSL